MNKGVKINGRKFIPDQNLIGNNGYYLYYHYEVQKELLDACKEDDKIYIIKTLKDKKMISPKIEKEYKDITSTIDLGLF